MISAYNSLITYSANEWEDYLHRIALYDIFKDLLKEYPDKEDFSCVVRYIVMAYSIDSDAVILNIDWQKNKQLIFEKTAKQSKTNLYEVLVLLRNKVIVETIQRWLDFQDSDTFKQLQILKDLRCEMQLSSVSDIKKASLEIDYDQKFKNAKYSMDLKTMIKDLEAELIQNNVKLKEAYEDIKKASKNKGTVGVEHYAK
jgi:ribosomal protein S20